MTETPSVPAAPRSYRPGGWFGILGSRASVLLPPSEKARVAALWALVDEGAGFDETLDALLAGGLRDLSGFVLVATTDDTTQIVLRGTATARLVTGEEVVELAGDPSATWVERSLTGVTSLSLVLEEGADPMAAGGYAVDSGLVRLARLDFPPPAAEPVPPSDAVVFAQPPAGPLDDPAGTDVAAPAVDDEPVVLDPLDSTPADDAPAPAADLAPPIGEDPLTPPASVADDAAPFADEAPAVDEALETPAAEDPLAASVSAGEPDDAAPPADEAPVIDEALETPAAEDPLAPPVSVGEPDDAAPASDETPAAPDPLAGPPAEEAPAPSEGGADGPAVAGEDHADPFAGPVVDGAADPLGGGVEDAAVPEMPPPESPPAAFPPPVLPPPPTYPPSLPGPPPGMPPGPPPSWTPGAPPPPPPATAPWPPEASPLSEDERPTNSTEADDAPTRGEDGSGEEFARSPVGIAGQPQAPAVTSRPVARLNISSSGETIDVDRVVVIGRAPEARRFGSTDQPMLVTVDSPHQEISSTHLEIRPGSGADHGSAVATDLGSTNGTVLVQPGLGPEELPPGVAVQLVAGAVLDLGDGVTIRVTNP